MIAQVPKIDEFRGITKKTKVNGNGISEPRLEGEVLYTNILTENYKIMLGSNSQQVKYYLLHYKRRLALN